MSRDPEDLLRDALRDDSAVGSGSFDDVRARARKLDRRSNVLKAGAAAVVVLVAIGVAIPLSSDDDSGKQRVLTKPGVTTTTIAPAVDEPIAIWPYVNAREADDKAIDLGFNTTDPLEVAKHFLEAFAGMSAESIRVLDGTDREANIAATWGSNRTVLSMRKLGTSDRWTVVSAHADGLVLDAPGAGQTVMSPVHVEGHATAFEGTVVVKITDRAKTPNDLGRAVLTGEMGLMKPFAGDVPFQPGELVFGAVIAYTVSAKDGSVEQVAAVPISWVIVGDAVTVTRPPA